MSALPPLLRQQLADIIRYCRALRDAERRMAGYAHVAGLANVAAQSDLLANKWDAMARRIRDVTL